MQETILKNGRQYRSHPVYKFLSWVNILPLQTESAKKIPKQHIKQFLSKNPG